ncbi:hypothetical protein Q1695_003354 [Nippostrongylus brasiliensis]|nr:hypothetical protein Q1695_003354 [Nippostrongylus brasiliensis]
MGLHGNVKLEAAFGRTAVGPNTLVVNERTQRIAYVAGACVVLASLDGSRTKEGHLVGAARHPLTCLAFSSCGRYIATGESGHQPHVRVWELRDDVGNFTGQSVRSFPYHSNSIAAVRFVPGTSLLISVGCQHDATMCVWDWRSGTKLATGRVTAVVNAIAVSPDNTLCVTVGCKHVKYWHLPAGDSQQGAGLQSRSAILADRRSSTFVDVVFLDANRVLSVTEDGALVEFLNKKYVKTYRFDDSCLPLCLSTTKNDVVLGCTNGEIRLYSTDDLQMRCRLPQPAFIGMDPAVASSAELLEIHPKGVSYPDVRAICSTSTVPESFIAAYSDRSMFVFERGDASNQWRKLSSSMAHVGPVTVVQRYPSHFPYLPSGSFITAGVDGTVRIWSMERNRIPSCPLPSTNLLSPTLKKIIHVEEKLSSLVEPRGDLGLLPTERAETTTGIRCLTISPDGKHLVAGTKSGNLHIIDLSDPEMNIVEVISAHEHDVMCVEYSDNSQGSPYLFASGGRDRLVHLFRPGQSSYEPCYVIDDHQSALNAVRFAQNHNNDLYLYTCGSDKTIIIWRLVIFTEETMQFIRENLISTQVGINDLLIPISAPTLLTSCQDRQLRSYSLSGKLLTTVRGTGGEADLQQGWLTKFCLDPSCTYVASVCSDRHVYIVELKTGKCVAAVTGIGESATDVEFSEDCRRLFVTASNGCIFIWRLSDTLVGRMQAAKAALDVLVARSESPDSLLGSGSEAVSEELPIDNSDTSSPQFGSRESLENWGLNETVTLNKSEEKGDDKDGSLIVRPAQVTRRSASNLLGPADPPSGEVSDHDGSKSDFISKRRESPSYTSSKSMMNLREMAMPRGGGVFIEHLEQPPRRNRSRWGDPMPNWEQQEWQQSPGAAAAANNLMFQPISPVQQPGQRFQWQQSPGAAAAANNLMFQPISPVQQPGQRFQRSAVVPPPPPSSQMVMDFSRPKIQTTTSATTSPAMRNTPSTPPSQAGLSQIAAISRVQQQSTTAPFRRDSPERKQRMHRSVQENKSQLNKSSRIIWSPQAMTPKRSTSNMQSITTPSGAAASAITRRQSEKFSVRFATRKDDGEFYGTEKRYCLSLPRRRSTLRECDYNDSNLHLRSRSQSPNHVLLSQQMQQNTNRSLPCSASRDLTKELQRRRDSDMSYTAASSRLTPASSRSNLRGVGVDGDTRKSTEALNRIAALRSKLHQSSENLRKSSDNLGISLAGDGENAPFRTRSISNLRGANALEAYGTFDADHHDSSSSLMHSRLLARSMGNVSSTSAGDGGEVNAAASRLQNTIDMLKKASNPDLTQSSLYEDPGSPCGEKMRRRGAVQKKVERYHPRHRTARNQTSEESDSNGSDASPLNQSINRRLLSAANNRSVSAVETSGRFGGPPSRRLFDQQRYATPSSANASPRRATNYLAQKMAGEDMVGPDLGSDDSPRSSVNSQEWHTLLEDGAANQQLVRHVQDCFEQLQVYVDKAVQARMLVDDSSMTPDQKRIMMSQIEKMTQKIVEKLIPGARSPSSIDDANGNDYTPTKSPQIYGIAKSGYRS